MVFNSADLLFHLKFILTIHLCIILGQAGHPQPSIVSDTFLKISFYIFLSYLYHYDVSVLRTRYLELNHVDFNPGSLVYTSFEIKQVMKTAALIS